MQPKSRKHYRRTRLVRDITLILVTILIGIILVAQIAAADEAKEYTFCARDTQGRIIIHADKGADVQRAAQQCRAYLALGEALGLNMPATLGQSMFIDLSPTQDKPEE